MELLRLHGDDLAISRSSVVIRDGQNVLMFPRERKSRSARVDPIRFTNAITVPKIPDLDCLHEFNARRLFSVREADFFCTDPTNFPPGPGSFSASPEQNQLPVPYSRRSPMRLHCPPSGFTIPSCLYIRIAPSSIRGPLRLHPQLRKPPLRWLLFCRHPPRRPVRGHAEAILKSRSLHHFTSHFERPRR
jgi:hypothetical protein